MTGAQVRTKQTSAAAAAAAPDLRPASGDELAAGSGVVEVYVQDLTQLFDSLDPSPFEEKTLHRNVHEYIVSASKELSAGAPAALVVYLAQPVGLPDEGRVLGDAIRVYFRRRAALMRQQLRERLRLGWITLIVGLTLLAASVVVGQYMARHLGDGPLATVLRESLLIGGWVAMWRPMDFFLFELWMMRAELRVYERLGKIAVRIVYTARDTGDARPSPSAPGRPRAEERNEIGCP
ncbi:MAG: hypothetical protein JWR37_3202 [Mycobacterium sp.]|nr:hypothetical protein [Mycobacterium sp.]